MSDAYTPSISNGDIMDRPQLDRIATASAALEARIATIEGRMAYGGMRMEIGATHSIALSTTPVEVTAWDTLSPAANISQSLVAGELTISAAGVYLFDALIGLSGIDSNTVYTVEAYVNNTPTGSIPGSQPEKKIDNLALYIQSMPATLAAGDVVSLYLSADTTGTVDIDRAMMRLYRIG